jgi:hypothetical protein
MDWDIMRMVSGRHCHGAANSVNQPRFPAKVKTNHPVAGNFNSKNEISAPSEYYEISLRCIACLHSGYSRTRNFLMSVY